MTDTLTIWTGVLGTGAVGSGVTYYLNRESQKARDQEAAYAARIAEAISIRDSDRRRLQAVEDRLDKADAKIDQLIGEKTALAAQVVALEQKIALLNVEITAYKENEIVFHIQIKALEETLAATKRELETANGRLRVIQEAEKKGDLTKGLLYQGKEIPPDSSNGQDPPH